jgi:hypothetical protein
MASQGLLTSSEKQDHKKSILMATSDGHMEKVVGDLDSVESSLEVQASFGDGRRLSLGKGRMSWKDPRDRDSHLHASVSNTSATNSGDDDLGDGQRLSLGKGQSSLQRQPVPRLAAAAATTTAATTNPALLNEGGNDRPRLVRLRSSSASDLNVLAAALHMEEESKVEYFVLKCRY